MEALGKRRWAPKAWKDMIKMWKKERKETASHRMGSEETTMDMKELAKEERNYGVGCMSRTNSISVVYHWLYH